jgi:hypothetical protein
MTERPLDYESDDFASWVIENPPPSVQALLDRAGGSFQQVTPEQWAEFDTAMAEWRDRRTQELRREVAARTAGRRSGRKDDK